LQQKKNNDGTVIVFFFTARRRDTKKKRHKKTTMTLLSSSSQKKIREEEKGTYLQAPTFTTTLNLLLISRSCYHHIEVPLARALLKHPALEAPMDFTLLKV
jgi:hypothetical protein